MTRRLEKVLSELSPDAIERLTRIAEEMVAQANPPVSGHFELKWAGALAHLADRYDSVSLQHAANDWRTEPHTP